MNTKILNKKIIIFYSFLMTTLFQAGLVLYTPAFLQVSEFFQVSPALVKTTITAYLLGFSGSQLLYGPISDRIGRRKPLLAGMVIFSGGFLWSILATSYDSFLISRFVQGLGAGATMTLSRAILSDCFTGIEYVKAGSYLSSGFAMGLGLAPLIGGYLLLIFPWQSEFVLLFCCSLILTITFWLKFPETKSLPEQRIPLTEFCKNTLQNFGTALRNVNFICYLVGGVLSYSVMIAFSVMGPFLFQQSLHINSTIYGWLTFIIAVSYYASTSTNRKFVAKIGIQRIMTIGIVLILCSGISMLLIKLVTGAFNVYVVFIPLLLATFGQALVWSNCITCALKDLTHIGGTAAAFFSCLQMFLSTIISAVLVLPHENNQIPLAITLIVLATLSWAALSFQFLKGKDR